MFRSILQRNLKNIEVRDAMFKIAKLSPSFSIADCLTSLEDLESFLGSMSQLVIDLLNEWCVVTNSTKQIQTMMWPRHIQTLTFRSKSCIVTEDQVKAAIDKE